MVQLEAAESHFKSESYHELSKRCGTAQGPGPEENGGAKHKGRLRNHKYFAFGQASELNPLMEVQTAKNRGGIKKLVLFIFL